MLTLLPGETIITQSNDDLVVLTNQRLCYQSKGIGQSYNQTFMLENISACECRNVAHTWLLYTAGVLVVLGFIEMTSNSRDNSQWLILMAMVCGAMYFITKQSYIAVSSGSAKMKFSTRGMGKESALSFVDKIETAKNRRLKTIH